MFNSVALSVVIGLVFIYLLYSLLSTIIHEYIANVFGFRAKFLQKAVIRMLETNNSKVANGFWSSIWIMLGTFKRKRNLDSYPFAKEFYGHPRIKYLAEDNYHSKPSYISSSSFAQTIIDLLRGQKFSIGDDPKTLIVEALENGQIKWGSKDSKAGTTINKETLDFLNSIWAESQGDVNHFTKLIENWYNETMERATGWYKKNTQIILLVIGLIISIIFNVDTLKIANTLAKDPVVREQIVRQAENYAKNHQNEIYLINKNDTDRIYSQNQNLKNIRTKANLLEQEANALLKEDLANANDVLAIGWSCHCNNKFKNKCVDICIKSNFAGSSLIGWLLTAFALSLGAPFWFDLLSKLINLKGSVSGESNKKDEHLMGPPNNFKLKG